MASMMSSMVMILVTLAGKPGSSAFFSYSTSPVSFSIRIADGAAMDNTGASAAEARGQGSASRLRARIKLTVRFIAPS